MVVPTARHHHHRRVSSTVSADCYNHLDKTQLLLQPQQGGIIYNAPPPPPIKKKVHFDLSQNQIQLLQDQDSTDRWYSSKELEALKAQSQQDARQMTKSTLQDPIAAHYRHTVKTLHHACHYSYVDQPQAPYQPHAPPPYHPPALQMTQPQLDALHMANAHHGLERWMKRLRHSKHMKLQQLHECLNSLQGGFYVQNDEWIRWHCERISWPSRLFAHHMAMACARSVHYDSMYYQTQDSTTNTVKEQGEPHLLRFPGP